MYAQRLDESAVISPNQVRSSFRKDYTAHYARVMQMYGASKYKYTFSFQGQQMRVQGMNLARCYLAHEYDEVTKRYAVNGRNDLYHFLLIKSDGGYKVASCYSSGQGNGEALSVMSLPYADYMALYTFKELIDLEAAEFTAYRPLKYRGVSTVAVDVNFPRHPADRSPAARLYRRYLFHPQKMVCLYQLDGDKNGFSDYVELEIAYQADGGERSRLPPIQRIARSLVENGNAESKRRLFVELEVNEHDLDQGDLQNRDFTLTAFGLPEPPWLTPATPEPAGVPWTIYGVVAGFGLLIVCILLSRRKAAAGGG